MWNKQRPTHETLAILEDLSALCAEKGGERCQHLLQLVRDRHWQEVVDFKFDYDAQEVSDGVVLPHEDFLYARQIQAFYSKLVCLPLQTDPRVKAWETFLGAEKQCAVTNRRLKEDRNHPSNSGDLNAIIYGAQRKIAKILGDVPEIADLNCQYGPGANINVKGTAANPRMKLGAPLQCSNELSPTVGIVLEDFPLLAALHDADFHIQHFDDYDIISFKSIGDIDNESSYHVSVEVVPGKIAFVPKNAKTDRTIMIEPVINSLVQKGIGSFIRDKLGLAGVNLRDQTRNQSLAREGSISGLLATIDLSSASDCIAYETVFELFPLEWAEFMARFRTGTVLAPNVKGVKMKQSTELVRLEKFSSMGNGFTFELESLLFYALAYSVCTHLHVSTKNVSVYGDDIIIPTRAYGQLVATLEYFGFSVNLEKSFHSGAFRESCGADYFYGFDIRPYYQKSQITEAQLYSMHNWFVRHCEFDLAARARTWLSAQLPTLYGPDGFGDGHLIGSFELRRNREIRRLGWSGGKFDTYADVSRRGPSDLVPGDYLLPSYSVYVRSGAESDTDPLVVRGAVGFKRLSIYTLRTNIFVRK